MLLENRLRPFLPLNDFDARCESHSEFGSKCGRSERSWPLASLKIENYSRNDERVRDGALYVY